MESKRNTVRTRNQSRRRAVPLAIDLTRSSLESTTMHIARTDDELILGAQLGDHEAFAELCLRHTSAARKKIFSIVRHREDAEDALQETLLRAYANLGRFRQSAKFSTWITAIGVNAALTVLRKKKSRRERDVQPSNPDEPSWDIADQTPNPEHRTAKKQMMLLLRTELEALPPKIQEVVTDYYDQDYSLQEAADVLGLSVPAVKSRLLRGRRSLRTSLEQKGLASSYLWSAH